MIRPNTKICKTKNYIEEHKFPIWSMVFLWGGLIFIIVRPIYRGWFWSVDIVHLYIAKNIFKDFSVGFANLPHFFRPSYDFILGALYKLTGPDFTILFLITHLSLLIVCIISYFIIEHILENTFISFIVVCLLIVSSLNSDILYFFNSGSNEMLVCIYILSIILLYLKKPNYLWLIFLLYLPAVFFKKTAVLIPVIFLAIDLWRGKLGVDWIKKMWIFYVVMILQLLLACKWSTSHIGLNFSGEKFVYFLTSILAHLSLLISGATFRMFRHFGEFAGKVSVIIVCSSIIITFFIIIKGRFRETIKNFPVILFSVIWILTTLIPAIFYLYFGYKASSPLSISAGRQFFLPYFGYCLLIGFFLKKIWDNKKYRSISLTFLLVFFFFFGIFANLMSVKGYITNGNIYKSLLTEIEKTRTSGILNIIVVGIKEGPTPDSIIYGDKDIYMYKVFHEDEERTYQHAECVEEARKLLSETGGRIIVWKNNRLKESIDIEPQN